MKWKTWWEKEKCYEKKDKCDDDNEKYYGEKINNTIRNSMKKMLSKIIIHEENEKMGKEQISQSKSEIIKIRNMICKLQIWCEINRLSEENDNENKIIFKSKNGLMQTSSKVSNFHLDLEKIYEDEA